MEMLVRLHELGHQRLRLSAGASPAGMHWRYGVAPLEKFKTNGYLLQPDYYPGVAYGSSNGCDPPFAWANFEGLDANGLAHKFLESFADEAEAGRGSDPEYARWFAQAVELCQPDRAFVMYGDYVDAEQSGSFDLPDGASIGLPPMRYMPKSSQQPQSRSV